jgi:hypothetical protein
LKDEAERSVRAGLDIVDAMAELNAAVPRPPGVELAVRIGIACGPVIVGDQIGEGTASETAVVGETPNLVVDQHRVGEAKFADRGGDLRDLLVAVRARVSGVGDQRRAPAPNAPIGAPYRRCITLVFLLYQKGRDSRIFQALDIAIDDFTLKGKPRNGSI